MIWDFIRDFFVQYIFGGYTSAGEFYQTFLGHAEVFIGGEWDDSVTTTSGEVFYDIGLFSSPDSKVLITLGDWLSTTATIICMCLIVFLLICLVRWIFRVVSSAFLLK